MQKKLAKLKSELNLNVVDDKVEQDIKNFILLDSKNKGLDPDFSGRILNLLINESVMIQNYEKNKKKVHCRLSMQIRINPTFNR